MARSFPGRRARPVSRAAHSANPLIRFWSGLRARCAFPLEGEWLQLGLESLPAGEDVLLPD